MSVDNGCIGCIQIMAGWRRITLAGWSVGYTQLTATQTKQIPHPLFLLIPLIDCLLLSDTFEIILYHTHSFPLSRLVAVAGSAPFIFFQLPISLTP